MHWIFAHLYVTGLVIAGLLLLTGVIVVNGRAPLGATDSTGTWGGTGVSLFTNITSKRAPSPQPRVRTEDLLKGQGQDRAPYTVLPVGTSASTEIKVDFNWEALMAQLVKPQGNSTPETQSENSAGIYSFIPSGLISTAEPTQERDEQQDALFEYGNTVGSVILGFDEGHANMLQVLKDAYQDRGNAEKIRAAMRIGQDYIRLGNELESLDNIPEAAAGMHRALANAYKTAGQKLIEKLQTSSDIEFLAAVNTYNASVDQFQKSFVALVVLFEVAEVQFSQYDPGSVFMFQTTSTF